MVEESNLNLIKREKRMVYPTGRWKGDACDMDRLAASHRGQSLGRRVCMKAIDKLPKQKRLVCLLKVKEGLQQTKSGKNSI